jgi:hypothetical protein
MEKPMKKLLAALAMSMPLLSVPAFAANNSQQNKMVTCNKDATGKKGDERKAFMKECLSNKAVAAPPPTQQQKMVSCNKDATGKKGDERKAFMKQCLSNKA